MDTRVHSYLSERSLVADVSWRVRVLRRLAGLRLESPIEELFLVAWEFSKWNRMPPTEYLELDPGRTLIIEGATFRLDFGISIRIPSGRRLALPIGIELDGHEFHERTKEQVARDNQRERAIARAGYRLIRFSGSEVWRAPDRCVDEAVHGVIATARVTGDLLNITVLRPERSS